MTDQSLGGALEVLPRPERIREHLARHVREARLLRQMLRLSERVSAERCRRREGTADE